MKTFWAGKVAVDIELFRLHFVMLYMISVSSSPHYLQQVFKNRL